MEINKLVALVDQWAHEKGWRDKTDTTVGDRLMLMVTELAEAMEEHRTGHAPNEVYDHDFKPEGIPIELADVIIRIADFCGLYKIDLEAALTTKLAFNQGRPYRHGGKVL
jgi:NTP pyrophosphatase (non-canonical NTP hydrolase)